MTVKCVQCRLLSTIGMGSNVLVPETANPAEIGARSRRRRASSCPHLRLIAALDETGVVSAAAQALNMSQPAASRMIGEMEALLEAPLCERLARGRAADAARPFAGAARALGAAATCGSRARIRRTEGRPARRRDVRRGLLAGLRPRRAGARRRSARWRRRSRSKSPSTVPSRWRETSSPRATISSSPEFPTISTRGCSKR